MVDRRERVVTVEDLGSDSESEGTMYPSPQTSPSSSGQMKERLAEDMVAVGSGDTTQQPKSPLRIPHLYGLDDEEEKGANVQASSGEGDQEWRPYMAGGLHKPSLYDTLKKRLEMEAAKEAGILIDGQPVSPPPRSISGDVHSGGECPPPPKKNSGGGKTSTPMENDGQVPRVQGPSNRWSTIHEEEERMASTSQPTRAGRFKDGSRRVPTPEPDSSPEGSPVRAKSPVRPARKERKVNVCMGSSPNAIPPLERVYTEAEVRQMLTEQAVALTERSVRQNIQPPEAVSPTISDQYTHKLLEKMSAQQEEAEKKREQQKHRKTVPLGYFGGEEKEDWYDYLSQFEETARWNEWDDEEKRQQMAVHLKGQALAINTDSRPTTYEGLVKLMQKNFSQVGGEEHLKTAFRQTLLSDFKDPRVYSQKLTRLARRAFPKFDKVALDSIILDQFKAGLTGTELRRHVHMGNFDTLDAAEKATANWLQFEEVEKKAKVHKPRSDSGSSQPRVATCATCSTCPSPKQEQNACQLSQATHECFARALQTFSNAQQANSGGGGPTYSGGNKPVTNNNSRANLRKRMICWVCHQEGHGFSQCPNNRDGHFKPDVEQQKKVDAARERYEKKKSSGGDSGRPSSNSSSDNHSRSPQHQPLN